MTNSFNSRRDRRPRAIVLVALAFFAISLARSSGQVAYPPRLEGARAEIYKQTGPTKLELYIYEPAGHRPADRRPAVIFFFGGGWNQGSPAQFEQQCRYLASRGLVAITADYRVASRHGVTAVECVKDAKSAVRWVRKNAGRLGVDPNRIAAGGGSAGGHIAAASATTRELDEPQEDASVSSMPNALVLFNPPAALARYGDKEPFPPDTLAAVSGRIGPDPRAISPVHHVRPGLPPAIVFFGTADRLLAGGEQFCSEMKKHGNRCELVTYE